MLSQTDRLSSQHLICPFFFKNPTSHSSEQHGSSQYHSQPRFHLFISTSLALFPIARTLVRQPRFCKNEVSEGNSLTPYNQARKMLLTETSFHWTPPLSQVLSPRQNWTIISHNSKITKLSKYNPLPAAPWFWGNGRFWFSLKLSPKDLL